MVREYKKATLYILPKIFFFTSAQGRFPKGSERKEHHSFLIIFLFLFVIPMHNPFLQLVGRYIFIFCFMQKKIIRTIEPWEYSPIAF